MVTAHDRECLVDFFCNPGLKNCWHTWPGIEPTTTTLDLSSQSGAYDLSGTATPEKTVSLYTDIIWRPTQKQNNQILKPKKFQLNL